MAFREFSDPEGRRWQVWDVMPPLAVGAVSEDGAGGWLSFQCTAERRRLYQVPPNWDALTDAQLCFLCRHAVPIARAE